jgi:hypothetical protein
VPLGTQLKLRCGEPPSLKRLNRHFRRKKKTTAQLSRAKEPRRGSEWGLAPLDFRLNFSPALRLVGAAKNAAAKQLSPELGDEVSGVVEKLSRKIHIETTKSYVRGVESVYL